MREKSDRPQPHIERAKEIAKRFLRHENAVLIIILAVVIVVLSVVTSGLTTSRDNMINVLLQSSIRGIASVGQSFVILTAGIDLSVGGVGLMGSILGSLLMTSSWQNIVGHPISIYVAIPIVLLMGAGWGALNGILVSRVMMPALIVTLAMWEITRGIGFHMNEGRAISQLPSELAFLGLGRVAGVPVPVIIFIAVAGVAYFVLSRTDYGRLIYSTGGNPVSTWLSGVKVKNIVLSVYIISGLLAALAGTIMTARTMSISMLTLEGLELDSIAAVVIGGVSLAGGRGNIIGVVLGVLIIGVVNNAMSVMGTSSAMVSIVKGIVILAAVAMDTLRRHRAKIR